jgi:enamine deaminase RidA (YjgF/YER057c/UK114 family)
VPAGALLPDGDDCNVFLAELARAGEPLRVQTLFADTAVIGDAGPAVAYGLGTDTTRLGSVLLLPWVEASVAAGDTPGQIEDALDRMDELLEQDHCGRDDVSRVTVFMRDVGERPLLNEAWEPRFPDPLDRPPHKYVPATLPEGVNVALRVIALPGQRRRVLEIPNVRHGDPMSMGALHGNLVVSSRIIAARGFSQGAERTPAAYAEHVLGNARTLLEEAGGSVADLQQATVFVGDEAYRSDVEAQWARLAGEGAKDARLDVIVADLNRDGLPRVEIVGLL